MWTTKQMERGWIIYKKNKARTQTTEWANGTSSINNKYIKNDNTIL